jgi:hypothetical protein
MNDDHAQQEIVQAWQAVDLALRALDSIPWPRPTEAEGDVLATALRGAREAYVRLDRVLRVIERESSSRSDAFRC